MIKGRIWYHGLQLSLVCNEWDGDGSSRDFLNAWRRLSWDQTMWHVLVFFSACSHGGLVEEGLNILVKMVKDCHLVLDINHYVNIPNLEVSCPFCKQVMEDINHLFLLYSFAHLVWKELFKWLRIEVDVLPQTISHLYDHMFHLLVKIYFII